MAGNHKKRKPTSARMPTSRDMLLPTARGKARAISLHNHFALAAFKQGQGNVDLMGELVKTVFVTFYLASARCRTECADSFKFAEQSMKALLIRAVSADLWRLDEHECKAIETILRLHDADLASLPAYRIDAARQWLTAALEKGDFPPLA